MKKTQKKILGVFGLSVVAATTIYAATLPAPEAHAATTAVDTLRVQVINGVPFVELTTNEPNVTTDPNYTFKVSYNSVSLVKLRLEYTANNGTTESKDLTPWSSDFMPGERNITLNLTDGADGYGYGIYKIMAIGTGADGIDTPEELLRFIYAGAKIVESDEGKPFIVVDNEDGTEKVTIILKDGNGEAVKQLNDVRLDENGEAPLDITGLSNGTYEVTIISINGSGTIVKTNVLEYTISGVPDAGSPDTGGLFKDLNISKEDYLVTGLIIFFVFAIVATGIIMRNRKTGSRKNYSSKKRH